MSDIRWEDPPAPRRFKPSGWWEVLTPLMEHPKRWAIVAVMDKAHAAASAAGHLRHGGVQKPPGRWEFAARTVDGEHRLYARYLGPDDPGDTS